MDGFLGIDKPQGVTSRDVVNQIQRLVRPSKVGHAGTLDPLATGLLVVALGRATRLIQYVQRMPKHYVGSFLLGQTSDTEDITGSVVVKPVDHIPSTEEVQRACRQFVGTISQRPPKFSALKVKGKRAYELARRGERVDLAKRSVTIHQIDLMHYEYPSLEIKVICAGGTYIRSLGRDIGDALGCGAVMSALQRHAIGGYTIDEASPLDHFTSPVQVEEAILPSIRAVPHLPHTKISVEQHRALNLGQTIELPECDGDELAAVDALGELLSILSRAQGTTFRPVINLKVL